jgi:hypothetical protein
MIQPINIIIIIAQASQGKHSNVLSSSAVAKNLVTNALLTTKHPGTCQKNALQHCKYEIAFSMITGPQVASLKLLTKYDSLEVIMDQLNSNYQV